MPAEGEAHGLVIVHDARPLLFHALANQIPYSTSPYHCLHVSSRKPPPWEKPSKTVENNKKKNMTLLTLPTLCAETTYQEIVSSIKGTTQTLLVSRSLLTPVMRSKNRAVFVLLVRKWLIQEFRQPV